MPEDTPDPIPAELAEAFDAAIQRYVDWWGESEAELIVTLGGRPTTIRAVAGLVQSFRDPLPQAVFNRLVGLMDLTVQVAKQELIRNQTYEGGAKALIALIEAKNEFYRRTRAARAQREGNS